MGDARLPPLQALPEPHLSTISTGIFLVEPLSRRGHGPGLIILTSGTDTEESSLAINNFVPSALIKWAEEGFTVVQIQESAFSAESNAPQQAIDALKGCRKCDQGKIGVIAYDLSLWNRLDQDVLGKTEIAGAVIYTDAETGLVPSSVPCIQHMHGKARSKLPRTAKVTGYEYPTSKSQAFASPVSPDFDYGLEAVAHTRNLTFLKRHDIMGGPIFDLEEIWDEHTYYEFENRSVAHTMATMVQEPYVNHVPTMTGGIGRKDLTEFYTNHFVFSNPPDAELELISRTVGIDRIVDEFIFKLTHDRVVNWLLPGVPATNKYIQVPMMAVVNIRGDRLFHEHISWDQGTVLSQIGLMPNYLPWTYAAPDATCIDQSAQVNGVTKGGLEYRVPVSGSTAMKMREKNSVQSNQMFDFELRRV